MQFNFFYISFILIILAYKCIYAADTEKFRFKIGFEFQEDNHLCNWAKERRDVQKIPIFIAENANQEKLWHLEIDGEDIEFVTPPFSSEEEEGEKLQISLQSIDISYKKLYSMKDWKKSNFRDAPDITICEWLYGINTTDMPQKKQFEIAFQKNQNSKLKDKLQEIEESAKGLVDSLFFLNIQIVPERLFEQIKGSRFSNRNCKPSFTPQVTIQHFLRDSIPLMVTLSDRKTSQKFRAALPFYSDKTRFLGQNYFSSENGILFLHALTITGIEHYKSFEYHDIVQSLNGIKRNFERYRQVDAKIYLDFLSRRPFSEMWQDIKDSVAGKSFSALYQERIIAANEHFKEAMRNFKFFNYAEEYYTNAFKRYDFLDAHASQFPEGLGVSNVSSPNSADSPLSFFLENGILSTGMIGALHPNIFENYLDHTITTVENPSERLMFDPGTFKAVSANSTVDSLSPPWFLHLENSMGFYSLANRQGISDIKHYGEAVLEMRSISRINPMVLDKMKIGRGAYREFLTARERDLYDDANRLYCYLKDDFNESIFESIKKNMEKL